MGGSVRDPFKSGKLNTMLCFEVWLRILITYQNLSKYYNSLVELMQGMDLLDWYYLEDVLKFTCMLEKSEFYFIHCLNKDLDEICGLC